MGLLRDLYRPSLALLTDLSQLPMAAAAWRTGRSSIGMIGSPVAERRPRTATTEQAPGHAVQPFTDDTSGSKALNSAITGGGINAPAAIPAMRSAMTGALCSSALDSQRCALRSASQR